MALLMLRNTKQYRFFEYTDTCARTKTVRIRFVWTRKFLYPQKIFTDKKNSRIRVDMASVRYHIHHAYNLTCFRITHACMTVLYVKQQQQQQTNKHNNHKKEISISIVPCHSIHNISLRALFISV